MTSTNDGKEVKSYQTSAPKSKTYFIELYKSLEARLSEAETASERTKHLCEAWRRVHSLCQHSAPTTHPHLLSWLQRHTARTVLQTKWQSQERKDDRASLKEAINVFIGESLTTAASRDGDSPPWEAQLVARGEWFKKVLENPWKHPVLNCLLNPDGTPPTDSEVLEWLKEERGVTFMMRLHTLVAEKCDDIAMSLATAVMERVRSDTITMSDVEQAEEPKEKPENSPANFGSKLKEEAGFTVDVWEMLTDMEFVLLHKRDSSRCITLAKQTPLRSAYQLIERLQSRLETSPREKRLWKNSKEVAVLIAQVVIARCMVVPACAGAARSALYCCARSLARLAGGARLPHAAAALAAPAPTAAHLHTLAAAVDAQLAQKNEPGMKPFVCELYVRAITAGMNELERLKLKTEKDMEARSMEQTLASWFVQLGCVLSSSDRVKCECALTAFSVHPSQQMYERIKAAPPLLPINLDMEQASSQAITPEFGSWASDSRGQSNFVKTSETLNMKARQNQANVLSTAILSEGEALGLSPELCQDITVLLSGPRVKTLSWDMDRELLLENCRTYLERTHGGTKAVTTELKYLNLNPDDFQYLPEEDEDESNIYYGIEKGYEHLVESQEPEDIWEDAYESFKKAESSYSSEEFDFVQPQRRRKTKKLPSNSEEDDPLSLVAETKRKEKKERPHSKERSKEKKKSADHEKKAPGDPLDINEGNQAKKDKPKKERKKKTSKQDDGSLASLVGMKVGKSKKQVKMHTDSDVDSQRSSIRSMNSEDNVLYDGMYTMDDMRSPRSSHSSESMQNNEFLMTNRRLGKTYSNTAFNRQYRPPSVGGIRIASPSPSKSHSPSDHSRNNSPTYISDEVKTSISKLLEFRRQKALEVDHKKPNAIMRDGSIAMDKINISPKGVAIPEIPKSYISKQNDNIMMLKKVGDILDYRNPNAIPSPVIQYASKNSPNKPRQLYGPSQYNNSEADRMTPSDRCLSTPPISDRFLDSVNLISIYDNNEPTHSRNPYPKSSTYYHVTQERQSNVDMSHLNYKDYLHEFSLSSYNQHMEKRDAGKKVIRPISRVTPVVPNMKSEPKTPQSAKQMQQKKPDGSLNTFSRLSYYKNKQTDMRKTQDMSQHNEPQTVGSKLDGFIMNHLRSQSAVNPLASPSNDFQALMTKYDKPHTSARDHPMLSNILQGNLSKTQFQQRSVTPPKSELSEKDHNDLLLLLRQQNALNKPQPVTACSKTVTNSTFNAPIASSSTSITSSIEYNYDSNASIASSSFAHSEIKSPKKVNEGKIINVLSTSIIKTADQNIKHPKPKTASTKKPSQGKPKKTEDRPKKAAAKPVPRKCQEEWENVMNAILKQKTPCRGPNALDMALNKSSFEKAFEDSLRKPTTLFTAPNTSSDKSNISRTEFNHESFVNITNAIATASTSQKTGTEKITQPILNIPKSQSLLKSNSKTKKPAQAPTVATLLKQHNIEAKTIDKLMQHNQIEVTKRSSSVTKIEIPEMIQKPSIIEKSAKTVPQRHVETPKMNVQQSSLNMLTKNVKENKLEVPKKLVKQTVSEPPKKEIKQSVDIEMKQSYYVGQRQDDPFISGIPNSDYDLLDELMDDDLRKEIGELSSDEESYNAVARGFLKHTINDEKNVTAMINHERKDIVSKAPSVVGEINSRLLSKQNQIPQSMPQKPMQQPQNNKQPVLMSPAKPVQNKPIKCLNANVKNVTTHIVTKPTQAYSNASLLRSNQITVEPNIYITNVPRPAPVKNVMLIPADLVYEGYPSVHTPMQTVPNIAPNTYIATNNAPMVNVYQATQFAAPVLSPLIITHAKIPPIVAAPVVNNVTCDTSVQPKPVTIVSQTEYKDTYSSRELHQPSHLATAQGNIVVDGNKLDAKAASRVPVVTDKLKTPTDDNVGKSGERKVLKEVQGKHGDEKVDCTKINQKVGDKDLKTQADRERLEKKRLAIVNRKISYFCGIQTIALGYSPIEPSTQKEKTELDVVETNYVKDDLISSNQNDLQELSEGVKSPATPDSYKENKNEPVQVRRILLRSANKFKSKISTPSTSPKPSLDKKQKEYLDSPNEVHSENEQSDIVTQNKPKRVSKRIRNKCVATPVDIKNNETKGPSKKNIGTTKVPKKNVHKGSNKTKCPTPKQDFNTDNFFDIETKLLGSTIPKLVTIDDSLDPSEISLPKTSGEEVVEALISDNKKDEFSIDSPEISVPDATEEVIQSLMSEKKKELESLPIQKYHLSVNKTTTSVEEIQSLKETRQSSAVSESDLNARSKTEESTETNNDTPEITDVMNNTLTEIEKVRKESNGNINEISVKENFANEDKVVIVTTVEKDRTLNDVTVKETIPKEIQPLPEIIQCDKINDVTVKETVPKEIQLIPELIQCDKIQTNEVNILNQVDGPNTDVISIPQKKLAKTTPPSKVHHTSAPIANNEVVPLHQVMKDSIENSAKADSIDKNNGQNQKMFKNVHKAVAPQSPVAATYAGDDDDIQIVDDIPCLSDTGAKNAPSKPSSYSISIENIITSSNHTDPLKKTVRIRLGNGKTFKGTISGSADVNSLLEDPKIKSLLMSQFEQSKRLYSLKLNVNKEVNGNTILSTQIVQRPIPQNPFETVSLISDDEEDQNVPQVFETEYGKHKISSIENDLFKKHQTKLKLKSLVHVKKLSLIEENAINLRSKMRTKDINSNKQTSQKCLNDAVTINLEDSPSIVCGIKSQENIIFPAIPSKYVQGIFNDIESILAPVDKQTTEEPIVLIDDSSNDSVDIKSQPKEKIDELKHMLLQDLGVVDNLFPATSESTEDVQVVLASEAIDLTDDPVEELIFDKVDDKLDHQKIINKKCFVKLVRCDDNLGKSKSRSVEEKDDNSKENIMPASVSCSGSFSILEESTNKYYKKTEHKRDISSPVMEIYDLVASLKSKFPTNRNIQDLASILPLKCDTEWTATKKIEYMQCLNDMTKEFQHILASESIEVPKLATLILSYIQRIDLVNRYNFVKKFHLSPISMKRKTNPASLPIAKISKLITPGDENRSDDCSRSSINDLSATDASDVTIVDDKDDIVDHTDVLSVVTTEELKSEEELPIAKILKVITPVDETLFDDSSRSLIHDNMSTTSVAVPNATKLANNNDDLVDDNVDLLVVTTENLETKSKLSIAKISKLVTPFDETLSDDCSYSSNHNRSTTDASDVLIVDTEGLAVVTTEVIKSEEELPIAKISKSVTPVDAILFDDCSRSSIHDLSATSVVASNATKVIIVTEKLKTEEKLPIAQIVNDDCNGSSTFGRSATDALNVTIVHENDHDIDVDTNVLEAFTTDEELKTEEKLIDVDLDITPDLSDTDVTNMTVTDCSDIDDFELTQKESELEDNLNTELHTRENSEEHNILNIEKVVTVFRNNDDSVLADAVETETREESMIDVISNSFKNDLVDYTEEHTMRTSRTTFSESLPVISDDIPIDCSGIIFDMNQIEEYHCLPVSKIHSNSYDNLIQDDIQFNSGIKVTTISQNNVVDESNTADDSAVDVAEMTGDLININTISQSETFLPKAREMLVDKVTTEKKLDKEKKTQRIIRNCNATNDIDEEINDTKYFSVTVKQEIAKEAFDLINNYGTVEEGTDNILCGTKIIQDSSETCIEDENQLKNQSSFLITSPTCGKSDLEMTSKIQNNNDSVDTNLIDKHNPENSLKSQINEDKSEYNDLESKVVESECLEITDEKDCFDSIVTKMKNNPATYEQKQLVENTITNQETITKSKATHFPKTNDEIVDALNKMFGEPEVVNSKDESETVIINHSENKPSSLFNNKNKSPSIINIEQKYIFDQQIFTENIKTSEEVHIDDTVTKPENSNQNNVAPQSTDEIVDALKKIFGEPEEDSMELSEVVITEKLEYISANKISIIPNGEDLIISAANEHHDDAVNVSLREGLSLIEDSDCETVVEGIVEMLSDEIIDDITIDTLKSNTRDFEEIEGDNVVEKNIIADSGTVNVASNNENVLSIIDHYLESNGKVKGIGTRYVFSVIKQISDTNEQDSRLNEPKDIIVSDCDDEEKIEDLKLIIPKRTYSKSLLVKRSSRNMKRKKDMSDFKTNERKYRKGKNIDYPKITASSIAELAYAKEYKRIIDYCSTIKFSYARPFHIDCIDVCGMLKSWPANESPAASAHNNSNDTEDLLYRDTADIEIAEAITDPLKQTLNEEIVNGENITNYKPIDINETNFSKGFGEMSGRVIQKIETGITKMSAATLSDVKQYQPFSLSEIKKAYPNISSEIDTQKVSLSSDLIKLKEKLRSILKNTAVELNNECMQDKKYTPRDHLSKFPFGLTSSDFMEVPDTEVVVNVVQVGQLSVNATAQNPVTCDPRVTHVSDASPSQCSDNSPGADTQATVETEYTELTTANITLPLVQEYTQNRHQSPPPQEQNSPGTDDDMNASTQTLSIVKIELMEEETSQEKPENCIYGNDFSPLPNNNVEYSFEDTSNNLFNTSVNLNNNSSNTDNASTDMFNTPTSMDNSFTNIFNSANNIENTYTNMDNMPSSTESSYTNMDNASTSMYSASPNMGNSSTEMDNTANMDDASPSTENTNMDNTAMNMDSASNMENSYTSIYNPLGSDSNDMSNNVGNSSSNISNDSPINSENRPVNMNNTVNIENSNNIENTAYDYTYENIEDYAANIENNNNADNYTDVDNYNASVENYPSNVDDYASNVDNYATNNENYSTGVENYASNVENYDTNIENYSTNVENYTPNIDNTNSNIDSNLANIDNPTPSILEEPQDLSTTSSQETKISNKFEENGTSKINQIEHAMNAAGISSESVITSGADELANLISQSAQATTNTYSKSTPINVMTLQQALAQVLPPPLNQTSTQATTENQMPNNPVPQQVLHIVQGNNAQTVINKSNGTHLLHIVQNKSNPSANGLSLVDAGMQQGGNQLIHIVNNGNQNNAQFLKRVNLLTNLTNAQGSNEQKMIQFVCKSADGKSIQLNAGHQRSMVLRLHPTAVPTAPKPTEPQDLSASSNAANSANNQDPQEIKSRSVYEENYAQFIQNAGPTPSSSTTPCQEKATSLPKFNQVFGKQSYQENQNEINDNSLQENSDCPPEENTGDIEQTPEVNNPPLLVRSAPPETTQAQPNPTPPMKQTISPMNIHTTMHGGVIYTRQIPVNIGGGQTINLITVPSTELVDDTPQKHQTEGSFVNQEGEQSSIIKLVPHHASNNPNVPPEENNTQPGTSNEANYTPQSQHPPVLTQMRIKLPMLSKGPHIVPGTRLVRPSFFQIQRNVIAGTNQPVYQQLVLTTAPSLGQAIRLPAQQAQSPQAQPILVQTSQHPQSSPHIPVQQVQHAPSSQHLSTQAHAAPPPTPQPQSAPKLTKSDTEPDSELSTLTLEQLREFDMVLEQVKERSVHPTPSTTPITKPTPADSTDGPALATTSVSESTQQVLYSVENSQPTNVVSFVNRKSTITSATTSFVRSPDSSGIVDTPSSSTQVHITHTVTSKSSTAEGGSAVVPHPKKKKKKKSSSSSSSALASLGSPSKTNALKPQEDEQTTQRILYILAEYKEQVENSPDKNKPAPRRRNQFPPTVGGSKRKRSHCSSRATCRREGVDMSPMHGEHGEIGDDSLITLGSEDSSCGTTFSECTDCQESHSPEDTTKVVRRLTFEQETTTQITQSIPPRNVIVGDRQTITVARTTTATTAKPTTTVLMPSNYILPVSMLKGGQQIAIMTNRGPKILVGAGDNNAGALLFQRLIGPGLKPVLTRPGVRHIRLPATALHNLQAFNIQTTPVTQAQPPDSTAHAPTPAPPDLVDTRAMSSPWQDREAQDKPDRGPSPDCTEPWNLPSSSIADDYGYEEIVRTDNMERTVLDAIPDRYSPDMEAQRIFDKMFDVDSKKSMYDSSRCGYDIDTSDGDDKPYPQVVQRKDGRHHRVTHVSTAALRHKYAILEHELRLQKSLSEECEDLGVDSPSASDLFPEADILFGAPSPAHEQTIDQCNTPPPIPMPQTIPQPDLDDQIATDQLLTHNGSRNDDLDLNLDDVGEIVTVGEDGIATIPTINAEEFARSHPNTTFHTEPEDGEIPPFTIAQGIKGRHITFHANRVPGTVVMAPQTTVISQATLNSNDAHNTVKFIDIDNMINSIPCPQPVSVQSVLVKESGVPTRSVSKFDSRKDSSVSASRASSKFDSLKEPGTSHRSNSKFDSLKEGTSHRSNSKFDSLKDTGTSHRSSSKFDSLKETGTASRSYSKFDSLKDSGNMAPKPLSKFDSLLTDSKLHLSNAARQVVHSTGQGTQVIRRLRYDERTNTRTNTRFHFEEPRGRSISDEVKLRNDRAMVESMGDNASSPGQPELFWDSTTTERHERRFHFSESEKVTKSPFDELLNDSSAYGPHTRLDSVIKAARPERTFERTSFEGISVSGSSDESRPLRTYPPKRLHTQHTQDTERHFTLKTTTTTTHHHELTKTTHHHELDRTSKKNLPRCQESEGRRRTGRGLVKRGCSCCNGSSAPPKKRSRTKKPSLSDCTATSKVDSHNLT